MQQHDDGPNHLHVLPQGSRVHRRVAGAHQHVIRGWVDGLVQAPRQVEGATHEIFDGGNRRCTRDRGAAGADDGDVAGCHGGDGIDAKGIR